MGSHSGPKILADNYTVRVFTSSGIFTPAFSGTIEVLVVAGGGGGGMDMGGGGGGGGVISNTSFSVTAGAPLTVTVGAGGFGGPAGSGGYRTDGAGPQPGGHQFTVSATNGSNSVFGSLTAVGGGYGGSSYFGYTPNNGYGNAGGSGGGASGYSDGNTGRQGTGTSGQGFDGGGSTGQYYSGGGGGAAAAGSNGGTPNGGAGVLNTILDLPLYWGGGGGGASYSSGQGGNGGIGGGGGGANGTTTGGAGYNNGSPGGGGGGGQWSQTPGGNGGQYTGGGGGGGSHYNATNKGGEGGSGIVIVRYLSSLGNSTGGSPLGQSPLKFMIDMGNTLKSWKGPPATNVIPNADIMSGWSNYYRTTASSTFITEFGTTGYRFTSQPSWNGVLRSITIPSTGTYTFSAWFRYLGGSPSNNGATVYISGWGGNDSAIGLDKTLTGVWQRRSITLNCTNTTFNFFLISYGGTDNGTGNPDNSSWEVTMPQAEAGSVATPFVAGTRSSTQALLDLTRLNTITATSLTYNANNTFSFNNFANSTFTIPDSTLIRPPSVTISAWVNLSAFNPLNDFDGQFPTIAWKGFDGQAGSQASYALTLVTGAFPRLTIAPSTLVSTVALPTNTWVNIVGTYTAGGAMVLYRNGEVDTTGTGPVSISYAAQVFGLGTRNFNGASQYPWNGNISLVQLYNRALTGNEVRQNFNANRGRFGV